MNTTYEDFLNMIEIGETLDIATSKYSIDPIGDNWNPRFRMRVQSIKRLERQGLIKVEYFWRGCTVTRLK